MSIDDKVGQMGENFCVNDSDSGNEEQLEFSDILLDGNNSIYDTGDHSLKKSLLCSY